MARELTVTERKDFRDRESSGGGIGGFVTGLGIGIQKDPFVALAIRALGDIEGADPEGVREIERQTSGFSMTKFGEFVGEWGPTLLFGIPLAGGGTALARGGAQALAKGLAKKAAVKDVQRAAARGALNRSQASGVIAREGGLAERKFLDSKLGQVARKADDTIGKSPSIQGSPILQRAAEGAGANLAFAGLIGAQEKARGKSDVEALKSAAIMLALGGATDAALVGGARLLFPAARTHDLDIIRRNYRKSNAPDKLKGISSARQGRVNEINAELRDVLNTEAYELELMETASNSQRLRSILGRGNQDPLAKRTRELLSEKRGLRSVIKSTDEAIAAEGTLPYIGSGVGYTGPVQKLWDKMDPSGELRAKWTTAAESMFGKFGSTGNRIGTQLIRAVTRMEGEGKQAEIIFSGWSNTTRKAMGATEREWKNGFGKNLNSAHAWETGGEKGLRDFMAGELKRSNKDIELAVGAFKARKEFEWNLYQVKGRQIGAKQAINLEEMGLKEYIPHASLDIPEVELVAHMVKGGKFTEAEAMAKVKSARSHLDPPNIGVEGVEIGGPARTGPLDWDRLAKGSTRDKILGQTNAEGRTAGGGAPLNPNVWDSGLRTAQSAQNRINLHPILGDFTATERGRAFGGTIDELVKAVEAEGFNGAKFRTVLETLAGRNYYNEAMRKFAVGTTSIQVATKLPLAVLANASQAILTTTWTGLRASLKAVHTLTNRATRQEFAQALSVHEHIIRGIGRSIDNEGLTLTSFEKAADWTLRFTGFSMFERWNRVHAAAATQVAIRDKLVRAGAGRLRGNHLESGRKMLGELGLDLNVLARDLNAMGPETFFSSARYLKLETDAVIRGAQKTQFFPGKLRTPSAWSSPVGRVLFQFKTFSVGQSRFIRDAVLTEWSNGNIAPLATLLSLAPIAGELVADGRAIIKGKDRTENGIARFIDNASAIGGLGIFTDALGQLRWGNLEGFLLGPTFSDITDFGEALVSPEGQSIWEIIRGEPAFQLGEFLMGTGVVGVEQVNEYLDTVGDGDDSSTTRVDIGQRLTERIQNKRQ